MPARPTIAQSDASRANGARSAGPVTDAGIARSAMNAARHGLSARTFFLLADEDPADYAGHEALWLAELRPRDRSEHEVALVAIHAMWREMRADRLEAQVLGDLFAAGRLADADEAAAAKLVAFKALGTLLRYRARIEREHDRALRALDALRQRTLQPAAVARPSEPEPASRPAMGRGTNRAVLPSEPEPVALNRHQRRALAAMERGGVRRAA